MTYCNLQLLVGFLDQYKDANIRIDYKRLATHMNSGVTACAVQNRIVRLRKTADKLDGKSSPTATPSKRKASQAPKTPTKKTKVEMDSEGEEETPTRKRVVKKEEKMKIEDDDDD
ncbi:hypothetical protein BBP40_000332 [Aspergillus hancockii]|nr:hypothetical protein BBP40_000332 [Aspergillus hancockii]